MKLVLLGAPGAGKGTQASALADALSIPHISSGDIFRENMRGNTPLGIKAKAYIDAGQLVPDELTIDMVLNRLSAEDCRNGYILDGFPRTIPQAEVLSQKQQLDYAVNVDVPDENIMARMSGRRVCPKCGESYHVEFKPSAVDGVCDRCGSALIIRDDDKEETVLKRLNVYHAQTAPLIDYYGNQGKLVNVDGTLAPAQVTRAILDAIEA